MRAWLVAFALVGCTSATGTGHSSTTAKPTTVVPTSAPASTTRGGPDYSPPPGALNPAVTQATIRVTICVVGWTATVRPPLAYTSALKLTQLAVRHMPETAAQVEEDHFIPLELGGAPRDPANLWPEPRSGAHASSPGKDLAENRLHREVCAGTISLAQGRAEIRNPANWHG